VTYGGSVHRRLADLGVAAIPFGLGLVGPGSHGMSWGLPLSAAIGASLYWRRRFPFRVLLACFALGLMQLTIALVAGMQPGFYDIGIIIAIYSAVAYGSPAARVVAVAGGIGGVAAATLVWVVWVLPMTKPANQALAVCVLLAPVLLAWALATALRTRRAYLAGLEDRAERLAREREALAKVAVAEERERIARELHDIIAHSVSLMIVASDGAEAIEVIAATRPDVVVMDVRMPRMDGVEATRRIRASDDAPKVLILTTFDVDEYVYEAIRAGASGFLLKDTGARNLIDAVRIVHSGDAVVAPSTTRRLLDRFATAAPAWRGPGEPGPAAAADGPLTARETEVLREVALGLSNAEIAERMYLSEATVRTHVSRILGKLGLRGRVQAVVYAYEAGLVRPRA
jgi:DNA-binding NarL/FixJ family response regulator